jgi:hypothetical protein
LAEVLTWPGNRAYITAIKAARDWSVPPSVLILRNRQPSDGWSAADKKLAVAFQILEDETCKECGVPVWIGHSDDENVVFEIKSRTCYSCAAIESARDKEEARKGKRKPAKGKKHFLHTEVGQRMPTRDQYYAAEAEKV